MKKTLFALFIYKSHRLLMPDDCTNRNEAAYAPFQLDPKMMQMELLKLTVPINMPMGTMSKSPKKVAEELGKKPLIVKTSWNGFNSSPRFW